MILSANNGILKKGFMNTQERISSKPSCKSVKVSMCKLHGPLFAQLIPKLTHLILSWFSLVAQW